MKRDLPALALLACLAGALTSCSGGGGGPSTAPTTPPPASAKPSADPAKASPGAPPPAPPASTIPPDAGEVSTTVSGLRTCVLRPGTGAVHPKTGDMVRVHYTGWLQDGTEFDSSRRHGGPAEFEAGSLIPGWNEALSLMTEGARWKITVPAALGYGEAGSPPRIPPGATLVFELELLGLRAVPAFRAPDPKVQKRTASGIGYEVLEASEGERPGPGDAFELEYALWTEDGALQDSSLKSGQNIAGRTEDMRLPFLKEIPFVMRAGETFLCEVPSEQGFGSRGPPRFPAGSKSLWHLRLVRVAKPSDPPPFARPPEAALVKLPGGLGMQVLKEGAGASPKMGESVVVHYAGWLTDGTLFDSSWQRGLPATFRLAAGGLIPGWIEGLQRMKPGGEALLVVPPEMGYGARGAGAKIPPNATLVFRVALIEVR